jgi:hypothetical protein
MLWFFQIDGKQKKSNIPSFFILSGLTLFFYIPWILFIVLNYKGQSVMDSLTVQELGLISNIMLGMFNDWAPLPPLTIASLILLFLFPFFSKNKGNTLILLALFVLPIGGLYLYCKLLRVTQFITSRYFINFLPLFLITLYLSLNTIEFKFERLKRFLWLGPKFLFLILLILSNFVILFPYYHSEKQDFRGLVNYLNTHIRDGDKIVVGTFTNISGILHYFGVNPKNRHYEIPYSWKEPDKLFEFKVSLVSQNRIFSIYHSNIPYAQYIEDGSRLWILLGKGPEGGKMKKNPSYVLKGYFDGSFAMFRRFPSDASMYLFLWDPKSPVEKGLDLTIE